VCHFGAVIAIHSLVLKITVNEDPKQMTLKLEGRIVGPWVAEFNRTWHSLTPSLDSKKVSLDLRGVTQVDGEGKRLLAEIYDMTGAEFQTNSLEMKHWVQEIMRAQQTVGNKRSQK